MKKKQVLQEKKKRFFSTYKSALILGMMNLVIIGILLLFMTHTTNQNTAISMYSQSIANLNIQNQEVEDKIAQAQDVTTVNQKAQELGMTQPSRIVYLENTNVIADNIK